LETEGNSQLLASGGRDKQILLWNVKGNINNNINNSVIQKFQGHRFSIMTLQLDETKIVSGSADNTIRIWDIHSGSCRQILQQGHNQMITCLKFDEEKIVSGSADRTLIVADFSAKIKAAKLHLKLKPLESSSNTNQKFINGIDELTLRLLSI